MRILSFADKRERGEKKSAARIVREPQGLRRSAQSEEEFFPERSARPTREPPRLRRSEKSEEELFPELSALRGFNMEERGMRRGGWEG